MDIFRAENELRNPTEPDPAADLERHTTLGKVSCQKVVAFPLNLSVVVRHSGPSESL